MKEIMNFQIAPVVNEICARKAAAFYSKYRIPCFISRIDEKENIWGVFTEEKYHEKAMELYNKGLIVTFISDERGPFLGFGIKGDKLSHIISYSEALKIEAK